LSEQIAHKNAITFNLSTIVIITQLAQLKNLGHITVFFCKPAILNTVFFKLLAGTVTMKKLAYFALTLLISNVLQADTLGGIFFGAYGWQQQYGGYIEDLDASNTAIAQLDFENDLGLNDDNGNAIYAAIEHGLPLLPNIKVQHTTIEINGSNTLMRSIEFDNQTFSINDNVNTESDLTHSDATFYYQIFDSVVSLDLGLTARWYDGFISVDNSTTPAQQNFNVVIPLVYAASRVNLPLTGLFAAVSFNALSVNDSSVVDYNVSLGFESEFGLGLEGGYRSMDLSLDDIENIDAELTVEGGYLGLFYHF